VVVEWDGRGGLEHAACLYTEGGVGPHELGQFGMWGREEGFGLLARTVERMIGVQKDPCWRREAAVHLFKCWVRF
jgi:hypothetical protein